MDGLPFLPGNSFSDPTKTRHHLSHSLNYKNGYALSDAPQFKTGGERLDYNQLSADEVNELANFQPTLTYGQAKQAPPEDFVPGHVGWDKKVMLFRAYFKQTVHESPAEHYRVRKVNIYYYLEDDSIAVVEPPVENSGIPQGKLIKRQRLPKNDVGDHWHWKDLNLGQQVVFYGKVFHIYECDEWTRGFLESEGIEVNKPEPCPEDPYDKKRQEAAALKTFATPSPYDKQRQFLEMDRKVLRFFAVWDDRDAMFGEMRPFVIHYYLVDDTVEVRESHQQNDGRDPFPVLIGRHKLPKDRYNVPSSFPAVVMELTSHEIKQYMTPRDFGIGVTVHMYGRRFLIYDMDNFTKAFYWKHFGVTDFTPLDVKGPGKTMPRMEVAPYNGYGSLDDSLQSCLSLIPQPPKKDFIKILENDGKILRFEAILDSVKPEEKGRRFIFSFYLSDDMISIYEPPVRNSGIIGGKFLEKTRIAKPQSTTNHPVYYGPSDLYIGAIIHVFTHRFVITNADEFVLKYMQENPTQFSPQAIESIRAKLCEEQTGASASGRLAPTVVTRRAGDLEQLVREVKVQLKRLAVTDKSRIDEMYRRVKLDRAEHIDVSKLVLLLRGLHLPVDDDLVERLMAEFQPSGPDGQITLEDFRRFFESSS